METLDTSHLAWRKSSRSSPNGSNCVELASAGRAVAVRDSKDPHGAHLAVSRRQFAAFAAYIKRG